MAAAACGDDNNNNPPGDACTGHLCGDAGSGSNGSGDVSLASNEGGNIIFEYIYFDTELQAAFQLPPGVTTVNRVMAYFMNDMTPEKNPLPVAGQCVNLETTKGWPLYTGSAHKDLDVGTLTISGKNTAGADKDLVIPKMPAGKDAIGRPHDIFYQAINGNAADYIKPDSSYTVKFGGAANAGGPTIPATTFPNAIYLANTFTVNNPDAENNGPLTTTADFTVHWTPAVGQNVPAGDELLGVTWLVDTNGSPTHLCANLESAGQFTIKKETIAEYKAVAQARGAATNKVILLRNAIDHKLQKLPNGEADNVRRIDMLSVMCWAQLMDVQ